MQTMTEAKIFRGYRIFEDVVEVRHSDSWSKAPNGSAVCHDFYTTEIIRQEWLSDEDGAKYDGAVYKITIVWIGPQPGMKHVRVSITSAPWS